MRWRVSSRQNSVEQLFCLNPAAVSNSHFHQSFLKHLFWPRCLVFCFKRACFHFQCMELQCYIHPLSSILNGLRSGRYRERKCHRFVPKKKNWFIPFSHLGWKRIGGGDDDLVPHGVLEYLRARFLNHVGVSSSHKYFLCVRVYLLYRRLFGITVVLATELSKILVFFGHKKNITVVGDTKVILYR